MVGRRKDTADGNVRLSVLGDRAIVRIDLVESRDRCDMRLGMTPEDQLDRASAGIENRIECSVKTTHCRHLIDICPHGPTQRTVMCLRRGNEGSMVGLDRLVRHDAWHDQLATTARAPMV